MPLCALGALQGKVETEALLDSIKVGAIVFLTGRVQPPPPPNTVGAVPSEATAGASPSLDVVCHRVTLLHPDRAALRASVQAAQEAGLDWVASAADLELLRWQQLQDQVPHHLRQGTKAQDLPAAAAPAAEAAMREQGRQGGRPLQQGGRPGSASASGASSFWQLPMPSTSIEVVDTAERLEAVRQEVMGPGQGTWQVVGLDCEWKPYRHNEPRSRVALLQIATRRRCFLVDLQAICKSREGGREGAPLDLSARERQVASLVRDLLSADHVLKLGFSLASDLDRLFSSYPWLDPAHDSEEQPEAGSRGWQSLTTNCLDWALVAHAASRPSSSDPQPASSSSSSSRARALGFTASSHPLPGQPALPSSAASSLSRLCEQVRAEQLNKSRRHHRWGTPRALDPPLSLPLLPSLGARPPYGQDRACSDWSARPLSPGQQLYAAADAAVLVALLDRVLGAAESGAAAEGPQAESCTALLGCVESAVRCLEPLQHWRTRHMIDSQTPAL